MTKNSIVDDNGRHINVADIRNLGDSRKASSARKTGVDIGRAPCRPNEDAD
jgi:hypothetical protein